MSIHVINGPNLNLLGTREPHIYGTKSLSDINLNLKQIASKNDLKITFYQSNHEGDLIDYIQNLTESDSIILNPGALSHYSIALRDCLANSNAFAIEIHISNIYSRETFRKKSVISDVCQGIIAGFGTDSYEMALLWLTKKLKNV